MKKKEKKALRSERKRLPSRVKIQGGFAMNYPLVELQAPELIAFGVTAVCVS